MPLRPENVSISSLVPVKAGYHQPNDHSPMLAIDPCSVHIWILDFTHFTDPHLLDRYRTLLSEDETRRCARFTFPKLQDKYLATRAMVRTCLSRYANVAPADWQFATGEQGKPYLLNAPLALSFNLTHSGERAVLAISLDTPLGIDIEQLSRQRDYLGIAQHYFHADEVEQLMACTEEQQYRFFFQLWTLKEAYLKARGTGIATGLDNVSFIVEGQVTASFATELDDHTSAWQFFNYDLESDYSLSLAVKQHHQQPVKLEFYQSWPLDHSRSFTQVIDSIRGYNRE